ncbi:MAG TPA: hypothetical protein VHD62_16355 [Opitutaceae bacterium]|nr:hypothetical protein [Opitutaceae bacterium]
MKLTPLALSVSLAANAALSGLIIIGRAFDAPASPAKPAATATVSATSAPAAAAETGTWSALADGDLAAQRDRLRAEGFPPATIRAILAAQIREGFATRRKALNSASADAPFWKPARPDPTVQAQLRALGREEQKAIEALLGPDPDDGSLTRLRQQNPGVTDEKLKQLAEIQARYGEQTNAIYGDRPGTLLPEERQKVTALQKAMHDEFATVLSPEEIEAYDLRASPTATQLRFNLAAFDATEDEYRAIFKIQSAYDDQNRNLITSLSGPPTPEQNRARQAAQEQLNADLKAALGDQRYADYQRATDYNYQIASRLVARLNLPPETANQVYAVQQDAQQRQRALFTDRSLAPQDREAQLQALAADAQAKITATLGATGFEAYKQYGGSWLASLAPRPAPVRSATGP